MTRSISIYSLAATLVFAASCSDNFMQSKMSDKTTVASELAASADAAGNYTAAIDPSSGTTQVLRASSGAVAGSAIAFPPGSLSIPVSVTIGEGETIASSGVTQQLGLLQNAASAAGPSVSFVPSSSVEATSPFTLSIPGLSKTSLALADTSTSNENLVVIYKWATVINGTSTYSIGILPRNQLTVGPKSVQFQTTKFGTFQLAVTEVKITEKVNKPTDEPPILKGDATNPLVGVWSACKEDSVGSNQSEDSSSSEGYSPVTVGSTCRLPGTNALTFSFANASVSGYGSSQLALTRGSLQTTASILTTVTGSSATLTLPSTSVFDTISSTDVIQLKAPSGCYFQHSSGGVTSKSAVMPYFQDFTPPTVASPVAVTIPGTGTNISLTNHGLMDNQPIVFTSLPNTADVGRKLYVRTVDADTFGVANNPNMNAFTLVSGSAATYSFIKVQPDDRGASFSASSTVIGIASGHGLAAGDPVVFSHSTSNVISTGLPQVYFVSAPSGSHMSLVTATPSGATLTFPIAGAGVFTALAKVDMTSATIRQPAHGFSTGDLVALTDFIPDTSSVNANTSAPNLSGNSFFSIVSAPDGDTFTIMPLGGSSAITGFKYSGVGRFVKRGCNPVSYHPSTSLICDGTTVSDPSDSADSPPSDSSDRGGVDKLGLSPGRKIFSQEYVKFSNNTFVRSKSSFEGAQCTGRMLNRREETGSYTLSPVDAAGVYPVTIKMATAKAAVFPPDIVAYANANPVTNGCGLNNWVSGVAKDLNVTSCKETNDDGKHGPPDAVKIENGRLYFRNEGKFDSTDMLIKQ